MADPTSSLDIPDDEWLKNRTAILTAIPNEPENKDDQGNEDEQDTPNNDQPNKDDNDEDEPNTDTEGDQGAAADQAGKGSDEGEDDPNKDESKDEEDNPDENKEYQPNQDKPRGKDGKYVKPEDEANKDNKENQGGDKQPPNKPANKDGEVDFKAQHDALLAPIKANGRDFQVKSVDEARHLISMGLNYNKKMAALKPNLAIMKQLQNSELLDPDKINFLIDLSNGNPQAIAKLIADHKVDPLTINSDDASGYKPTDHRVDEVVVDLDNIMDELKDHPKFGQVMQLVGKEWDKGSQQMIAQDPKMLRNLAAQMESGIYDRIDSELQRRKLFGTVSGKTDLEAYREIGNELATSGAFDDILKPSAGGKQNSQQKPTAQAGKIVDPRKPDEASREQQRRAAAPNKDAKPVKNKGLPDNFDPLNMSDEEFKALKIKL